MRGSWSQVKPTRRNQSAPCQTTPPTRFSWTSSGTSAFPPASPSARLSRLVWPHPSETTTPTGLPGNTEATSARASRVGSLATTHHPHNSPRRSGRAQIRRSSTRRGDGLPEFHVRSARGRSLLPWIRSEQKRLQGAGLASLAATAKARGFLPIIFWGRFLLRLASEIRARGSAARAAASLFLVGAAAAPLQAPAGPATHRCAP